MELLQDSVHCKLKTAHACCIAGTTQESMMPISRHFYPKCKKGPNMSQHVKKFVLASLPPCQAVMNKTQICPFGQHYMLETSWAWMEIFPTVIKCQRKCSAKMMDLLMATMTLMMNALHLLRIKVNKIEGCLTHAMNAAINIIWWLNIWRCSLWCSYSSFNLLIGAACQMQPWVSLLAFPIILSMYLLINVTLLSCTTNKERLKIYLLLCSLIIHREWHESHEIWHMFGWNNISCCMLCLTLISMI